MKTLIENLNQKRRDALKNKVFTAVQGLFTSTFIFTCIHY